MSAGVGVRGFVGGVPAEEQQVGSRVTVDQRRTVSRLYTCPVARTRSKSVHGDHGAACMRSGAAGAAGVHLGWTARETGGAREGNAG